MIVVVVVTAVAAVSVAVAVLVAVLVAASVFVDAVAIVVVAVSLAGAVDIVPLTKLGYQQVFWSRLVCAQGSNVCALSLHRSDIICKYSPLTQPPSNPQPLQSRLVK